MDKSFAQLKAKPYFEYELAKLMNELHAMGIKKSQKRKLEKTIQQFIRKVQETIFRHAEYEYHREDVMNKIKEYYGTKGSKLVAAVPERVISAIVETWQDDIGNADTYWDVNWSILEDVLYGESWLSGIENYNNRDIQVYKAYLKDWFSEHNEGCPVCIDEFFNCEMRDEELRKYYLGLAESKKKKAVK